MVALVCLTGCGGNPRLSTPEEIAIFQNAGPAKPTVDFDKIVRARPATEPYHVVKGDVLELVMPDVMRAVQPQSAESVQGASAVVSHLCRVTEAGTIVLPAVGEIEVAGKRLSEIEAAAAAQYYPKFLMARPSVVARVVEYQTQVVTVTGAVANQGAFALRSDEMSLVTLLMKAGGVDKEGAGVISIQRSGAGGAEPPDPVVLPIKDLKTPFADLPLQPGDVVEVQERVPGEIMVVGLVTKVGVFPYPPRGQYNLMQTLALAGGVDMHAEPQFVSVYRNAGDGRIIIATLSLEGVAFGETSRIVIKPGDVVAVEHSVSTRARQFLADIARFGFGFSAGYNLGA